jgi:hypothetical protein
MYAYAFNRPTNTLTPRDSLAVSAHVKQSRGDPGLSLGFGGYVGKGSVTYTCETQPRVQCRATTSA